MKNSKYKRNNYRASLSDNQPRKQAQRSKTYAHYRTRLATTSSVAYAGLSWPDSLPYDQPLVCCQLSDVVNLTGEPHAKIGSRTCRQSIFLASEEAEIWRLLVRSSETLQESVAKECRLLSAYWHSYRASPKGNNRSKRVTRSTSNNSLYFSTAPKSKAKQPTPPVNLPQRGTVQ